MKASKKQRTRQNVPLLAGFMLLAAGMLAILLVNNTSSPAAPTPTPQIVATANPTAIAYLTALPAAVPPSPELTQFLDTLAVEIEACDEYRPQRRQQIQQHIQWLRAPGEIPQQVAVLISQNPTGRLIFGMADYTASEWRLNERPPVSCLRDIGLMLNPLLVEYGEAAITIYENGS